MAYDAMAGYIYELDSDVFAETIPDTYQSFLDVLERHEVSTDDLGLAMDCDDWNVTGVDDEEAIEEMEDAYKQVRRMFEAKTGLQIVLTYVDNDSGSRYNEVGGGVWHVLNAVEPTEPAKTFERFIDQKFFCTFG